MTVGKGRRYALSDLVQPEKCVNGNGTIVNLRIIRMELQHLGL
jgi:hypothetical protein